MRSLAHVVTLALLACWNISLCPAQPPSAPREVETLLTGNQEASAAADNSKPYGHPQRPSGRPQGTLVRPDNGVDHPDLDEAWADYNAAVTLATENIRATLMKQLDSATEKGDLDTAEKWQKAQERFEKTGEVPTETDTQSAVRSAVAGLRRAKDELTKAYEAVVKTLTIEKHLSKARAAKNELELIVKDKPDVSTTKQAPIAQKQNLLLNCDVTKNTISGTWTKVADGIQSDGSAPAKMVIPFRGTLPEQYDFEIEFTPLRGDLSVNQLMSAFGTGFGCGFGGWGNKVVAFELVDGRSGDTNRSTTRRPTWLVAGRRHHAIVQVRRSSVAAFLDGQHVVTMPTNYRNLTHRNDWAIPIGSLGIGTWSTPTLFHRASLLRK